MPEDIAKVVLAASAMIALVAKLTDLLQFRDPGFRWDGTSGSEQDDAAKVRIYQKLLHAILLIANTGFPGHNSLTGSFAYMQVKHCILESTGREVPNMVEDAVFQYRAMCKIVYNWKKSRLVPL